MFALDALAPRTLRNVREKMSPSRERVSASCTIEPDVGADPGLLRRRAV